MFFSLLDIERCLCYIKSAFHLFNYTFAKLVVRVHFRSLFSKIPHWLEQWGVHALCNQGVLTPALPFMNMTLEKLLTLSEY